MEKQTVLVRRSDIYAADMNGETVMMDPVTGKYYNIGAIGGRIWELLEKPMTAGEVIDALLKEYNVSPEQCEKETTAFFDKMIEKGLLTVR